MPDGFERLVYGRDGRDTGDAASEGADLAEDGFVDDAPGLARPILVFQLDAGSKFQGRSSSMRLLGCPAAIFSSVVLSQA